MEFSNHQASSHFTNEYTKSQKVYVTFSNCNKYFSTVLKGEEKKKKKNNIELT